MRTSRLTILIIAVVAVTAVVTVVSVKTVYAAPPIFCANCGASELAPGEEPKRPGWDPNGAPEDAPGQLAEKPKPVEVPPGPCEACAKDFAPGQEGLDLGIIGPPKKIQ